MSDKSDETQKKLDQIVQTLLPWWSNYQEEYPLTINTEVVHDLDRYKFLPVSEVTIPNHVEDVHEFINNRFQTLLSAAYQANLTLITLVKGHSGKNSVYVGVDDQSGSDIEFLESILSGVMPGKKIDTKNQKKFSTLLSELPHGGIVTGIPSLKNEDEKQYFDISTAVRSMYGRNFVLAFISKPVPTPVLQTRLKNLLSFRDVCHELALTTIGTESGSGITNTVNQQRTKSNSTTRGFSESNAFSIFLISETVSESGSETNSDSTTEGKSSAQTQQSSTSRSNERQNGLAREMENIADHFVERMKNGFNTGFWETTISFAAQDKLSCDILGGSLIGELSKPSDKLYPPRVYTGNLDAERLFFFPKENSNNPIFPKGLASYITSSELVQLASLPKESLPGYEVKKMPKLALSDSNSDGKITLGSISDYGNPMKGAEMSLSSADLNKHLFVCGLTGSGKTTTIKNILKKAYLEHGVPFLVIESAKRDYRQLLGDDVFKDKLHIYSIGDATVSPIRFNPFYIQYGVYPSAHIDYLKAIFNASFSLYGPMPHIVEKCLHTVYIKKGWDLSTGKHSYFLDSKGDIDRSKYSEPEHFYMFPTLEDLKNEIDTYITEKTNYSGELRDNIRAAIVTRLESLCVGSKGLMFNTNDFYSVEKLLSANTILEMENLADDDDKAFFTGLMLVLINEHRQRDNPAINPGQKSKGLQHFLVVEEAHRLLKNIESERSSEMMGNPKGKAIDLFCNAISEMRSFGQGVAVVEQIPSKIAPDVLKNTNTKIVHRLVSKDDQSLLAGSLSISDDDALYLNRLKTGHALVHKEGMERPVECQVHNSVTSLAISESRVEKLMASKEMSTLHSFKAYELSSEIGKDGKELVVKLLNSLCIENQENISELINYAKTELQKITLRNNSSLLITDELASDFFTKEILKLLTQGTYKSKVALPEGTKDTIESLLNYPNKTSYLAFAKLVKKIWSGKNSENHITDIISELLLKKLLIRREKYSTNDLRKNINSFFINMDEKQLEKLSSKIERLLEEKYA
jgi:hypothetical protein